MGAEFMDDLGALLWSGAYVVAILSLAEVARRRGVARTVTRKIVHIGIGTWVGPTYLLYDHRLWAVVPPLLFVAVNALSYRYGLIKSVEGEEKNIGSLLYPLSVALALALFWEESLRPIGLAAILVMAWGDAAASLVGRRWGRHLYRVAGHPRSLEGSAAMFLVSIAAIFAAFGWVSHLPPDLWMAAVVAAAGATLVEGVSLWGVDNFLVPAGTALVLWSWGIAA